MSADNGYQSQAEQRRVPLCPRCGNPAREQRTRYGIRASCCGLWSWDRWPLVDKATHQARNQAHAAFDPIWKNNLVSRSHAYALLASAIGISATFCHIKMMDREQAEAAARASRRLYQQLSRRCTSQTKTERTQ
jgi:hypothetical protein